MMMKWKGFSRKWSWPNFKVLEGLRKTIKTTGELAARTENQTWDFLYGM
jgi:hypothetical protein